MCIIVHVYSEYSGSSMLQVYSAPTGGRGIGSREGGGMCKIMGSITGMRLVRLLLGILDSILNFKLHEVGDQRKYHI